MYFDAKPPKLFKGAGQLLGNEMMGMLCVLDFIKDHTARLIYSEESHNGCHDCYAYHNPIV
jgi:hypothetical protein